MIATPPRRSPDEREQDDQHRKANDDEFHRGTLNCAAQRCAKQARANLEYLVRRYFYARG
jgi:hypothetical protein